MDLLERIKKDIETFYGYAIMYNFDSSEYGEYKQALTLLNVDHGFLDVVLAKDDFSKILNFAEEYKENDIAYKNILQSALMNLIIEKASGVKASLDEPVWYNFMLDTLKRCSKDTQYERPRLHVILDDVDNELLQVQINDLFVSTGLTIMGYSTKPLLTYFDSFGTAILPIHDYIEARSAKRVKSDWQRSRK